LFDGVGFVNFWGGMRNFAELVSQADFGPGVIQESNHTHQSQRQKQFSLRYVINFGPNKIVSRLIGKSMTNEQIYTSTEMKLQKLTIFQPPPGSLL
jgi:hypothetical protein